MKTRLIFLLTITNFLLTISCLAQDAEQIYKKVNDAVVTVYAYDSYQKITMGTQMKMIAYEKIRFLNPTEKIISCHKQSFLSAFQLILKIADHTFPSIAIDNSDLLNVGQKIYAIGSPMGFENKTCEEKNLAGTWR